MTLWILVADATRARFFSSQGRALPLRELDGVSHPRSRTKGSVAVASRPGRDRTGPNRRSVTPTPPHGEPKDVEAERFADGVCDKLKRAHQRHEFELVAIAAPPEFLGLLRERLDSQVRKCLVGCLHKNYTDTALRDLPPLLEAVRDAAARAEIEGMPA
jgi:protein required for attachment to host cells